MELTHFPAKHAAETQHEDFGYTRKQNMRWLQDQYDLPDHGEIPCESALELLRYFNVRDERRLIYERLSEEARAVLARLEEERQMMREAWGVSGRVKDWWMEQMLLGVVEDDGKGEGLCLVRANGEDDEGGVALGGEEHVWGAYSPVMRSPAGSDMDDDEIL